MHDYKVVARYLGERFTLGSARKRVAWEGPENRDCCSMTIMEDEATMTLAFYTCQS
jgi:hypothetical protein